MFDARDPTKVSLAATRAPELPLEKLLLGKTVEEAAALLPRLFNLCREAQGLCARLAFGLPGETGQGPLAREILRDHLLKVHVTWPGHYGFSPDPLPADWAAGGAPLAQALFGAPREMPATPADFLSFLDGGTSLARILARIDASFAPGEADTGWLPSLTSKTAFRKVAAENSVAGRHAFHPVMRWIAETRGHGPLWRATARGYDIAACLADRLPVPRTPAPGSAIVAATRGSYAVTARMEAGRIAAFARVTPTDHLLAPGGILDRTLAALPPEKNGYAPLILDILDPCTPVRLTEVAHA
jgi:hypothetical protein